MTTADAMWANIAAGAANPLGGGGRPDSSRYAGSQMPGSHMAMGNRPGLLTHYPGLGMGQYFGRAHSRVVDARGQNAGTSANAWHSILYMVKVPNIDWFNNNIRKEVLIFVHRQIVDLVRNDRAPSSFMHSNTDAPTVVMQHMAAVNYDLMRQRHDAGYPKNGRQVAEKYWFAGVVDSAPAAVLQNRPSTHGNRVNVVDHGLAGVLDVWEGWLQKNRDRVAELGLDSKVYVPNVMREGTPLWLIVREVAIKPDTVEYHQTQARVRALAGHGADADALGVRDVRRNIAGVPISIVGDPGMPRANESARLVRTRDNSNPYHWCFEPFAMLDMGAPPSELLASERSGGPDGYAIRVGRAFMSVSERTLKMDEQKIASIVSPSAPGVWNAAYAGLSRRQIMLDPYQA